MKSILIIFGTRPEAVKLCPLVAKFRMYPSEFKPVVCVTGQHREMLDQFLELFKITPDYDLNIMRPDQSLEDVMTEALSRLGDVIQKELPDIVLIQGDTTTTMAGALAAFYHKVKVGHVEAGLRSHDKYSPYPEEINRKIVSVIADMHFAPTENAKENLIREGVEESKIFVTGNTVIDALQWMKKSIDNNSKVYQEFENIDFEKLIVLVTGHRRENFGEDLENICKALIRIALSHRDVEIVYPVHLNPNVRGPVYQILNNVRNIHLIEPVSYEPFVYLMDRSHIIITDSGGVQEEAPSLGKPVLVTRKVTERPEGIASGCVRLVGSDETEIFTQVEMLLQDPDYYQRMAKAANPYGDGKACERIVESLRGKLGVNSFLAVGH